MGNQFVAYMDEHHGLGSWVAENIAVDLFDNTASRLDRGRSATAPEPEGRKVATAENSMGLSGPAARRRRYAGNDEAKKAPPTPTSRPANSAGGSSHKTWTSPRMSASATAAAVISGQAQVAVYPLYDTGSGFNTETLNTLLDFPQEILTEYAAKSNFVLAVPTDLVHQADQSGFSDSFDTTKGTRTFQWNSDKQRKYRNRVGVIYASPDAMRQCASAVAGWRAKGIDVRMVPEGMDVYREGLARAAELLDPKRQISTKHGADGQERVSTMSAASHNTPLIGVVMSFDKAFHMGHFAADSDYQPLETELIGAEPLETIFVATTQASAACRGHRDGASADFAALDRFLCAGDKSSGSDEASSPLLVRSASGGVEPVSGPWDYARILYALPTVGAGVADHSPVLKRLAEQNLSYRTVTLEGREGSPMVVAIDVPSGLQAKLKPVMRAVHRLPGARRLGVFPATRPMVAPEMRPKPPVDSRLRVALLGGLAILASAAAVASVLGS
ncbi:MAG: hypothetical protein AAFR65_00110 [Pseudomonadota bacterium]